MERAQAGRYKFICFTETGKQLMVRLAGSETAKVTSLSEWVAENFATGNQLVFIGAIGIAVRAIAPFCKDKMTDPGVVVIDEGGAFVIPVLSGHIGGAVETAKELAARIGAVPVITTATDVRNEFAVDVFAKENAFTLSNRKKAREFSARLLAGSEVSFTVTPRTDTQDGLVLIPRCTVVGMGCRKGKSCDELYDFLKENLAEMGIEERSLKAIVSADKKKQEQGLTELADRLGIPFVTYSSDVLMRQEGEFEASELVREVTGADNVCERAVVAYGCHTILKKKTKRDGMTLAIGMVDVVFTCGKDTEV